MGPVRAVHRAERSSLKAGIRPADEIPPLARPLGREVDDSRRDVGPTSVRNATRRSGSA